MNTEVEMALAQEIRLMEIILQITDDKVLEAVAGVDPARADQLLGVHRIFEEILVGLGSGKYEESIRRINAIGAEYTRE